MADDKPKTVFVSHLLARSTKKGVVQIGLGKCSAQLGPEEARQVGRHLLEAADMAESDEALFSFWKELMDADDEMAGELVVRFRAYRMQVLERNVKAAVAPDFANERGKA